jgi:esterase/lipase superfamily enzyme
MRIHVCCAALALAAGAGVLGAQADSSRDVRDSVAIAGLVPQLARDSVSAQQAKRDSALIDLTLSVAFRPGSFGLDSAAQDNLKRKAWLLYFNPAIRLTIVATIDTANRERGLGLSRARVDTVRRYLASRAIEPVQVAVEEVDGSPAESDTLRFRAPLNETSVVDVPPTSADPPARNPSRMGLQHRGKRYRWGTVRIFYATDRARSRSSGPTDFYGGGVNPAGTLEFGRIEVTVPRVHRSGVVEQPHWYTLEASTDPNKHMEVRRIQPRAQSAIMDSLRTVVRRSSKHEALVFIHGYNVTFHDAALRTAQLTYDLGFDGAPVLYSWPSRGSLFRYSADQEAAEFTAARLATFLDSLVAITGTRRVHVIAHSMGNLALTGALERLALQGRDTLLSSVIMAAADVPVNRFEQQIVPTVRGLMRHMSIYVSAFDQALLASRVLSSNVRVGEATSPILVLPAAETIDATAFRMRDLLGHGYVGATASVLDDLSDIINRGLSAPRRRLERMAAPNGLTYWRIR